MNEPTERGGVESGEWKVESGEVGNDRSRPPSLAIIGGGLAGLAAAVAAVQRGVRVELFEQAKNLGGRAGSFVDAETGQRIDYCQHVAMGCCTSFLDFCRRTGIDDCFERFVNLHFIGPEGAQYDFTPSRWLPSPLHLLPGLMNLKYLTLGQRWGIIRTLGRLTRQQISPLSLGEGTVGSPLPKGEETIGAWLRRQGQSEQVIERFWSVVLISALSETVDRASLAAARKVFLDGFLASREASHLILPRLPLGEIFHDRLGKWLANRDVQVHLDTPIRQIEGDPEQIRAVVLSDGTRRLFDFIVVAVPWRNVRSLFDENLLAAMPALAGVEQIEPAAITAVHLWFDRPLTTLPHAVLVGRLGQWVFFGDCPDFRGHRGEAVVDENGTVPLGPREPFHDSGRHYCQVVISASHRLPKRNHDAWLADVRRELESIWPAAGDMRRAGAAHVEAAVKLPPQHTPQQGVELPLPRLLHGRVVTQPAAVFSVVPGLDRFRPAQHTDIKNLALAGDWTATGWPATMEGAIRSGYRAVEHLTHS